MISNTDRLRAYCEYLKVNPCLVKQDGCECYTRYINNRTGEPSEMYFHNGYYVITHEELRLIIPTGFPIEKLPGDNFTCSQNINWHFQLT